jgi:hypothetical protein
MNVKRVVLILIFLFLQVGCNQGKKDERSFVMEHTQSVPNKEVLKRAEMLRDQVVSDYRKDPALKKLCEAEQIDKLVAPLLNEKLGAIILANWSVDTVNSKNDEYVALVTEVQTRNTDPPDLVKYVSIVAWYKKSSCVQLRISRSIPELQ